MNEDTVDDPQRQERLQEILLRYVEAAEAGTPPDERAFLAEHPEFVREIADFLADYRHMVDLVGASSAVMAPARRSGGAPAAVTSPGEGASSSDRPVPPTASTSELGQIGDYRLLREIGRGGMGVVYEAEQISLRRRVALKILPFAGVVDARRLQRFRNEAEAAAHLHHSHIVPVYAVGSERGVHFYAMQFIEGQSLAHLIEELSGGKEEAAPAGTRVDPPTSGQALRPTRSLAALSTEHTSRSKRFFRQVATLARSTAEALEYAHQMGVVHRDIKPGNLLLDGRGEVWITDFGLAQFRSGTDLTMSGEVLGTLRYASPEQAMAKRGLVDHRTDIYSLGATLYELLTLRPVFDGKDRHALLHQIGFEEPPAPRSVDPTIPVELETILLKSLAKNPAERYATAQDLADDLQRFLDDRPIAARRPNLVERTRKWCRRHPAFVGAAVVLLILGSILSAIGTVIVSREQHKTQNAYDELDAAFAKLAQEEKRTKAALKEVAAEQERTRAAFEAEARQRNLAEADFAQALRAVELIVQFSEGELAHRPGQQDVRRRLLSTVLDYYEEFLAAHAEDPAGKAELALGRERVALILTELSGLRGTTLRSILQDAGVQRDLALDAEQQKSITRLFSPQAGKDKKGKTAVTAAVLEKGVADILNPAQRKRFQEIVLQVQQQGRHGFSDPKVVEALHLTGSQREEIRRIQNEAHQTWSDHLFSERKIAQPPAFWKEVQGSILQVLTAEQRSVWDGMIGMPIVVDLREGYPWDGRNVSVPRLNPFYGFPRFLEGSISVLHGKEDLTGSGFGHKVRVDDKQYYCWRGQEIPPTAFEIAVAAGPLSAEEARHLLTKEDKAPPGAPSPQAADWLVLFRSADPAVWNTDSADPARFAVPVDRAPPSIRYLRLKRMDTGDILILPITRDRLARAPERFSAPFVWNGSAEEAYGGLHLGIAETRGHRGPPRGRPPR